LPIKDESTAVRLYWNARSVLSVPAFTLIQAIMDLTIPYTFYPSAMPHRLAWLLFLLAIGTPLIVCATIAASKRTRLSLILFFPLLVAFVIISMVCGMIITFFTHNQ